MNWTHFLWNAGSGCGICAWVAVLWHMWNKDRHTRSR